MKITLSGSYCFLPETHLLKIKWGGMLALLLLFFQVTPSQGHSPVAKEVKISLSLESATFRQVLREIERQSELHFFYAADLINNNQKVNVSLNGSLEHILETLFAGKGIVWQIKGKQIVLNREKKTSQNNTYTNNRLHLLPAFPEAPSAPVHPRVSEIRSPEIIVKGRVSDEKGDVLPGVSILLKGTQRGTVTDEEGRFSIDVPDGNAVLVFSFVGYVSQEVATGNRTSLDILLEVDEKGLEEVVVVGYGTRKKSEITGAISSVSSKMIENRPVSNLANALQGTMPGLTVTRTNGQPGSENIQIQVRGATSANGNINPLLLVDGVAAPIFTLQTINPNDIENVTVLKDAAAAAIYGAQAAGGVVLVTTKKGESGKATFHYSGQAGIDWALNVPKRMGALEEFQFFADAWENTGMDVSWAKDYLDNIAKGVEYAVNPVDTTNYIYYYNKDDKVKQLTRRFSPMQSHNLSVRGGVKDINYLISLGYYDKGGVFKFGPDNLSRYNGRLNLDTKLNKYVSVDTRISYTLQQQRRPSFEESGGYGILYQAYRMARHYPYFTPEGRYNGDHVNTYANLKDGGYNNMDRNHFDGVFTLQVADLLKGFRFRAIYGTQYNHSDQDVFFRTVELWNRVRPSNILNNPNQYSIQNGVLKYNNLQFLADYDFAVGPKNQFKLLAGYQFEDSRNSVVNTSASNLISNDLPALNLGDNLTKTNSQSINTYANQSYFGRLNYNFDNRLLVEGTVRVDESSRLAPRLRRKAFPAVSASWNIHNEQWVKSLTDIFPVLKVRASWGQLGSALGNVIGNYDYISLLSTGTSLAVGYPANRVTYFFQNTVPSSSLTWETVETSNLGIDVGLLRGKLQFSADYYVKYNRNMLAPLQLPANFGLNTSRTNSGELKSWGWEMDLNYTDRTTGGFNYAIGFNLFDNQNKLLKYSGRKVVSPGSVSILEGYPLNSLWGYKTDGYFQTQDEVGNWAFQDNRTGAGDIKYLDLDQDDRISPGRGTSDNSGDLVYLGTDQPRLTFGINGSFQFKNFDFSAFFQGVGKRNFFPDQSQIAPLSPSWIFPLTVHRDYWTPDNPNALFPRPYASDAAHHNYLKSDKWLMNGRYIRLKNVQLGYSLSNNVTKHLGISRARIYIGGQDLFTVSGMKQFSGLIDPENRNNAGAEYPFFATLMFGINVTF